MKSDLDQQVGPIFTFHSSLISIKLLITINNTRYGIIT